MATDKLMNHSQGESIITNLGTIATNLQNVTAISPAKFGMGYAVCDTAAGTAAKTANIANYVLTEGALVTVKFTNANTASNATLNLNNTGAKPILYKGSALTTDIISAGDICTFIYSTANSGSYNIINVDALSGAGAGTVKSVGAEGGLTTDQTAGAAISTTGSVKLNLKSDTAYTGTVSDPATTDKVYPVALDGAGHPCVGVPWTDTTYSTFTTSADGLVPAADGTGESDMFLKGDGTWATPQDTTYTGTGAIDVNDTTHVISVADGNTTTKGVVQIKNSVGAASSASESLVVTEKAVASAIEALPEPMIFKGTVNGTYPATPSVGDTYKATADSNSGVTPAYKIGDTVIYSEPSTGTFEWVVIPSGDEPSGTVTAISVNGTQYDPATGGVVTIPNYPDISGKIDTAGTGLSKSGTTLNHSNSVTAKTTASALKVKYDAQGHITGSAALSASDIGLGSTGAAVTGVSTTATSTATGYIGISSYNSTTKTLTLKGILAPTASTFVKTS